MCRSMEELWLQGIAEGREEGKQENMVENARRMLADGILSLEKIAEYIGLTLEEVQKLQAGI